MQHYSNFDLLHYNSTCSLIFLIVCIVALFSNAKHLHVFKFLVIRSSKKKRGTQSFQFIYAQNIGYRCLVFWICFEENIEI